MDTTKNENSGNKAQDLLQQLQKELEHIDTRYDNPELNAQLEKFMQTKGYVKSSPGRGPRISPEAKGGGFTTALKAVPVFQVPDDLKIVRYFLMEMLWATGADIVLHEYKYLGMIADVISVVSGRATEYELKCSRDDFFRDFKKMGFAGSKPISKHGSLANGSTMMSKFYFVVPENMIDLRECPAHAGMIWYSMDGDYPVFRVIKHPALLNKTYLTPGAWQNISKRLMTRCRALTDRYVNTRFRDIKRSSIYQPTKTN